MGICIAYRGKLCEPAIIPDLVSDLKTKAKAVGWPCKTMAQLVAEGQIRCSGLEGITLLPHRACDPVHFHFDADGAFVNHLYYALVHDAEQAAMIRQAIADSNAFVESLTQRSRKQRSRKDARPRRGGVQVSVGIAEASADRGTFFEQGMRYNFTKTQFAGPKVHAAVCAVLRHVQQRYAPELEIKDDSGFFEDGDYEKLESELAQVDHALSLTKQAVETVAASGRMTLDTFIARINAELAEAPSKLH